MHRTETIQTIPTIATPPICLYIVTLIDRRTGRTALLEIETTSTCFGEVMREICHQKVMRGLLGFEVFEFLDCNDPF